jgi:ABC-type multidrug transport system fused ATPase/permease subunit
MSPAHDAPVPSELRRYARLLGRYLRPHLGKASAMAVLLLAATGLQLAVPQLLQRIIDGALQGDPLATLRQGAAAFLAVALGQQLAGAGATVLGADVAWSATNALRRDLFDHVLRLDLDWHAERSGGELIERVDGDVTALSNFFSQFSVRLVGGLLLMVGILVALWFVSPWLGAGLTAFAALELAAMHRTRRVAVPASELERQVSAETFGFLEERLAGLDDLRANGGGRHALHRFESVMRRFHRGTRRAWMLRSVVWLSSYAGFVIGVALTLGFAIERVRAGAMTLGEAYMVFQYMLLLQVPIEQIAQQLQEFQKAAAGAERIGALLATGSALTPRDRRRLPAGALAVELDDVDFRYGAAAVLRGVDLRLPAGATLGLLGRTGSGKSTLVRLLLRLYDPSAGAVRLGGVDLRDVDDASLRDRVALVSQEVQLFQASVRDNLTFFSGTPGDDRLREVLTHVGLDAWLAGLPDGLDTRLASGGRDLSAGEAQLLALARAFLKDPGLVVLDEPSSRLDPATQARLERTLDTLLAGRTVVVIAHRLETVRRADRIAILDDGVLVEHGARQALAADAASRYARLLRAADAGSGDLDAAAAPELAAAAAPELAAAPDPVASGRARRGAPATVKDPP